MTLTGKPRLELSITRHVGDEAVCSPSLFEFFREVVRTACGERRNVRPTHPGFMAQVGLNTGARHARVIGFAKSYTKSLDGDTRVAHDSDIIGALGISYSLLCAKVPQSITQHVENKLAEQGMPRLATRDVDPGNGFSLQFDGVTYAFTNQPRSPPESYATQGYVAWTHKDPAYCDWAFSYCVGRTVAPDAVADGGANFVEVGLKILVKQACAIVMAFCPEYMHGTTEAIGAFNLAFTFAFSRRIETFWNNLSEELKNSIRSANGAGEGNPDQNLESIDESGIDG
ncbi:hypothetical protein EUX98_g9358 [Antrodiella citrinella]|uniref:Uncharacterized protein n=1 Tax=Antrodiella citrinella TaxID=2447956 RepID=A0A4S4LUE6_9APHY|nr:hypothetical protein EUX98_g9358 [Antrodiella citrinella]